MQLGRATPSPCCAAFPRYRPPLARRPATGSTTVAIGPPTARFTRQPSLVSVYARTKGVERTTLEGCSKREIERCLKRYIAREVYTVLKAGTPDRPLDAHESDSNRPVRTRMPGGVGGEGPGSPVLPYPD